MLVITIMPLILVSCGSDSPDSEAPDTPVGVVEAFFANLEDGDCDAAMGLLSWESYPGEIEIFIKNIASASEIRELEKEILSMEEVESVYFMSKEEALERMREQLGENSDMLGAMSGNPLPASFQITVRDSDDTKEVASRFFENPTVDNTPGSDPPDAVKYAAAQPRMYKKGCEIVLDEYEYRLEEFEVIETSDGNGEAQVRFSAVVSLDGTETTRREHVFLLVKEEDEWNIDYLRSLNGIEAIGGFFSIMLVWDEALAEMIDALPLGTSETKTSTATVSGEES
jgi:hypothetical protein